MRQSRTVPSSIAVFLLAAILAAAVVVPVSGASTAAAASIDAAFRDLPTSVRTGDMLKVQVDVPDQATCVGSIIHRDNTEQKLKELKESDGRCRWDVIVPDVTRRGEADVAVTIRDGDVQTILSATVMVVRRSDTVGIELKELPASTKRGGGYTINISVPDNATCSGQVTYSDGKTQSLDSQPEYKERCRWEGTVPSDVERGTARAAITINLDGRSTTLFTSFDVDRDSEKAKVLTAFQDLPTTVRRDDALPIRLLVPGGARCTGEGQFRSSDNIKLPEVQEQSGICSWSIVVPEDTKRGDSRVKVTVKADGDELTIDANIAVDETSSDVDAAFKDLPSNIQRGDNLEVRVSVPDGATCHGDVTFDDGTVVALESKTEKKSRCLWSIKVPNYTPRGVAVVRVWIDDHGIQTTLVGNVDVEGRGSEPITSSWDSIPTTVKRGTEFTVSANATSGASCTGQIDFVDGMRWTLGDTQAEDSRCRWKVQVPNHVSPGKAKVQVKVQKSGGADTLKAEIDVTAP
ncbi:MAG: hypothetical protein IT306_22755 [Chloroflexi bacterium]|nr:hypothetical protein [Chloroflexota bacterium]